MKDLLLRLIKPSRKGRVWQVFVFIIALFVISGLINVGAYYNKAVDKIGSKVGLELPHAKEINFRLGLDLLGGTHLVYKADVDGVSLKDRNDAVEGVRDVIERRVNVFGVSEPVVQTNKSGDEYRIIVELAGIKDVNEAIKMIGETPLLEFKERNMDVRDLTAEEKAQMEKYNKEAEKKAESVLGKVLSGGDFAALAKEFSEDEKTKDNGGDLGWITEKDNEEIVKLAKSFSVGKTSRELVTGSQGYEIAKLEGRRVKTDQFSGQEEKEVKASHLLICYSGAEMCESGISKEEAYAKISSLKDKATPFNFVSLVKENSTEPGASERGGDLGWFGKGMMVEPFEKEVYAQAVGTISNIVETKFGYHLIYKQDERKIDEYSIRHILVRILSKEDIIGSQNEWKNTELTGKNLEKASVQFNPNDNSPEVALEFDSQGSEMFAQITERNVGKPVAIFLDNYPISVPNVNEKITGGKAVISGNFNIQEAKLLAQRLNAGALPVPISLINQQTIGASLGKDSLVASLEAGLYAFLLVAVFMVLFYRLPGFLSIFALLIYTTLVLAIFKIWPVTLTLSGVAGFIMSIGMAVDANVLIFSRLREELKKGKPLDISLEEAFARAWPSIRDSNMFTIITCIILITFTTSMVKGFAVTLIIGVVVSMFSAIVITRNFLRLIPAKWLENKPWLIGVIKK